MKALSIALFLLACAPISAQGADSGSPTENRLRSATVFAFGGIGFAGIPAPGEVALREIMKAESAVALLVSVLSDGSPEAKCYALAGLHVIAPKIFEKYAAGFREHPPERVRTMSGCLASVTSGHAILSDIEAGRYAVHLGPHKPNKAPEPTLGIARFPQGSEVSNAIAGVAHL